MAGINFTDEQEYAPKLSFKNNEVLPLVSNSAYLGKVCKWCKSTKTHYDYVSIEGVEIWQCDSCKQEFLWNY